MGMNYDINVPGAQAYNRLANEVFQEDLETQINRKMFSETKRPLPEPLAWDMFRWTGEYDPKKNDPFVTLNPMVRKSLNGGSNDGVNLWDHNKIDRV
jgi:hypothetical protein